MKKTISMIICWNHLRLAWECLLILMFCALGGCYLPILEPPDDGYEPNNSRGQAADINSSKGSTIDLVSKNEDWFIIGPIAPGTRVVVQIDFNNDTCDLDLQFVDPSGSVLQTSASNVANSETTDAIVAAAGTYTIRVYVSSSLYSASSYTLLWNTP